MTKDTSEKNMYLLSLEKGVACINQGITFAEMRNYLKEKGIDIINSHYQVWFFENFYVWGVDYETNKGIRDDIFSNVPQTILSVENRKGLLKGHAYIDYLEYLELQESKASSKQAKKIALWSIWISGLLALGQIVEGIFLRR